MDVKINGAYVRHLPNGKWQARYNSAPLGSPVAIKPAGTWATEAEAKRIAAAKRLRVLSETSLEHDFDLGTTLGEYVEYFLKVAQVEMTTKRGYASAISAHVLPTFGKTRFADLRTKAIRIWLESLRENGATETTVRRARAAFSVLLTSAVNDEILDTNPAFGIRLPKPVRHHIRIINPTQFQTVLSGLETEARCLFLELQIETGCRLNELLPITPGQLSLKTGIVYVNRALMVPGKKWSGTDDRFSIKPYPKNRKPRRVEISRFLMERLVKFVELHNIEPNHVIFSRTRMGVGKPGRRRSSQDMPLTPEVLEGLGWIIRGNSRYRHGTTTGYRFCKADDGKTCAYCRTANRQSVRRRREGVERAKGTATWIVDRSPEEDVCPFDSWREFFYDAVDKADIGFERGELHAYHMRHAHASWLIRQGGVDPFLVMEQLGHKDLTTLKLYVPEPEETENAEESVAVMAMNRLRGRV